MQLRRTDRAVTDLDEVYGILGRGEVGHLGLVDADGPYVVPVSYAHKVVDGRVTVYVHGSGEGRRTAAIAVDPRVCFEVAIRHQTILHERLDKLSVSYSSVIGQGVQRVVTDPDERVEALSLIVEKYAPGRGAEVAGADLPPVTVVALDLDKVTAKKRLP